MNAKSGDVLDACEGAEARRFEAIEVFEYRGLSVLVARSRKCNGEWRHRIRLHK